MRAKSSCMMVKRRNWTPQHEPSWSSWPPPASISLLSTNAPGSTPTNSPRPSDSKAPARWKRWGPRSPISARATPWLIPGSPGAYAEYTRVPAERLVRMPEGLDITYDAAAMLQRMTAHYLAYTTYPLQAGDTCLIHAAAGEVESAKKRRGFRVIHVSWRPIADSKRLQTRRFSDPAQQHERQGISHPPRFYHSPVWDLLGASVLFEQLAVFAIQASELVIG